MPSNKRQHYVPRWALEYFASDAEKKRIDLVNIKSGATIRHASLRKQCYKDYFYGDDLKIETSLGNMEGVFASVVSGIIGSNSLDRSEWENIATMIALQRGRTLQSEEEMNTIIDKISKVMMAEKFDSEELRKLKIKSEGAIHIVLREILCSSPILYDLKQFLVLNRSSNPFILSDNPVTLSNWFGRRRFRERSMTGLARSGLQVLLPLSPRHALLLHDGGTYAAQHKSGVITLTSKKDVGCINKLQWLNAHHNVYVPPGFSDAQILELKSMAGRSAERVIFRRAERIEKTDNFVATAKDENDAPSEGRADELVHMSQRPLALNLHLSRIRIRNNPIFHYDGSIASPMRDPVWHRIVNEFATLVVEKKCSFGDFWGFVAVHPLVWKVGPRLRGLLKVRLAF